jgi:hypothetical protein
VGQKINAEIQTVTPGRAEQWLGRNEKNRSVSKAKVDKLAAEMNRGAWTVSPDAIAFAPDGRLLNGQHRLTALLRTGMVLDFLVVYGLPDESQLVMDDSKTRTVADQLYMRDETNYVTLAGALAHLYRWEQGAPRNTTVRPTRRQGLDLLDRHPNIRLSVPIGKRLNAELRFNPSLGAFLHYTLSLIDDVDAKDFFERLGSGEDLKQGDPIHTLRKVIIENSTATKKLPLLVVHAYTIKAWNAYHDGEPLKLLRWRPGGANPEPFPEAANG